MMSTSNRPASLAVAGEGQIARPLVGNVQPAIEADRRGTRGTR